MTSWSKKRGSGFGLDQNRSGARKTVETTGEVDFRLSHTRAIPAAKQLSTVAGLVNSGSAVSGKAPLLQ
ncbi:hypothetical protein RSal33209_1268 [Renibacterium salmoninarum ATCC 33209]|uniref:Uncharacterized protein n=1 Tax=Renibacterium salmoninarum (strain ATCC 33209 / DSM 20767 / JCM 11484 / NBRC 15589 / NCIMB 2235) TaxID=288705 RepID=A9WPP7_RENSM|nr:hypothetical protein RSal33209_1268 [Renibacterium salmoninarum ATCC 33209]